jgi:hypothetical protein
MFPYFQEGSFVLNRQSPPRAVNLANVRRMAINWKKITKGIFRKKEGNTNSYSIKIKEVRLVLELGTENFNKEVMPNNLALEYRGCTRLAEAFDLLNNQQLIGKMEKIKMPESLLFFLLPKDVALNQGKFQDDKDQAGFLKNYIENISIQFNEGDIFHLKQARANDHLLIDDAFNLETHLTYPIACIPVDPEKMKLDVLNDDGTTYSFPHVYVRLSPGYNQRFVPNTAHQKLEQFEQVGDLKFDIRFKKGNPLDPQQKSLLVYALYNDVHAIYNPKEKRYSSLYNLHNL